MSPGRNPFNSQDSRIASQARISTGRQRAEPPPLDYPHAATGSPDLGVNLPKTVGQKHKKYPRFQVEIGGISFNLFPQVAGGFAFLPYAATLCGTQRTENRRFKITFRLLPLDGFGSSVPSLQLHPVFGAASSRVPPGDTMSRFVGFGDKSWDNSKNFFQTQGFEFLFLSQRARRDAFASSILPKTPVSKLNRPFARKPPAAIASELTRAAFMLVEKPQVAALRRPRVK